MVYHCILSRVKQITSPGWMHETSAQGWCTGKTERDRVEREVGGGTGMGNAYKSMADPCQCTAKTTTILQSNQPPTNKNKWKKKIRGRKKKRTCLIQVDVNGQSWDWLNFPLNQSATQRSQRNFLFIYFLSVLNLHCCVDLL